MRRLWVTGYRSYELNVFKDDDPKVKVIKKVLTDNLRGMLEEDDDEFWLLTGPQLGVERWAAESGLALKKDFPQLKVAVMLPFADFAQKWNENNQNKLAAIREQADFSAEVSSHPYQSPRQLRAYQRFMLDHTERLLLLYDPDYEGKPRYDYQAAQRQPDYPITLVDFDDLQKAAVEWSEEERERRLDEN
jgi:uncharacterized phage-like protein YoqJ